MPVPDLRALIVLTGILTGVGALLLGLGAVDLARALCSRLWRLVAPGAARAARFNAALAAYQDHTRMRVRRPG